ncbi:MULTISPECIES: arsinothricin resistance N-acetyltransferase ArsN1 family B [Halorussus]|uniref:arsinothricin resistance N-acetyltransferase ArsN1 family B n=1 Tax=Halorussus TaxID=1070314 RepID=UPI000E2179DD|nr:MULTISPECIES: arsinothricin resistance N-acetyltransferase ArsN1 family B [Halorussus]NHN60534.1 N-acetyltransferase [Halorussus sp. JP-T4]
MKIRLAREADAAGIRAVYAPIVEHTVVSFEADPPSEAEVADRVADTLAEYPWLVCEIEDSGSESETADSESEIAGYAYAGRHRKREAYRWSVDVSVYVAERHRRQGVGRGLYESLFEVLRLQRFYNAYAGIALPNAASVGLHESLGFEPVGVYESVGYKRGAWRDVGWWQLALRDRSEGGDADPSDAVDSPAEPRPLPDVRGTPAFETAVSAGESAVEP